MATLFNPFFQAIDGNGVPISGALFNFYQTGTSSRQNTYTDSTLATPNANPVVADSTGRFPPIYLAAAFDYKVVLTNADGSSVPNGTRDPLGFTPTPANVVRSYLTGLTLSAAGSTGTFGIAAGLATDSTNVSGMALAGAYTKTTGTWMVGSTSGSLDTGTIANATWYHVFLIQRPDTNVVDVLTSLSASSPTLPANYTLFRRIGAVKTDGSAHFLAFVQLGDLFQWATAVPDITAANPGTAAVTATLSAPTGVNAQAWFRASIRNSGIGGNAFAIFSDLATADISPVAGASDLGPANNQAGTSVENAGQFYVRTNTSAQIRYRVGFSDGSVTMFITTLGWIDTRGKS